MSDLIERQWKRKIKSKETLQRMAGVSEEAELHGLDIDRRFIQPTPYLPPPWTVKSRFFVTGLAAPNSVSIC